jgi:hypothetical protein
MERVIAGEGVLQIREELDKLVGEIVGRGVAAVALQSVGGLLIAARRTAEAEIDPVGKHACEHGKSLGHLERAVVRQHHPA